MSPKGGRNIVVLYTDWPETIGIEVRGTDSLKKKKLQGVLKKAGKNSMRGGGGVTKKKRHMSKSWDA